MTGRMFAVVAVAAIAVGGGLIGNAAAGEAARPGCDDTYSMPPLPAGWTLELDCDSDSPVHGLADLTEKRITVWPRKYTNREAVERAGWHEAGHAWDDAYLNASERLTFRGWRGHSDDTPWWYQWDGVDVDHDQWADAPAEDLARVFVACLRPDLPTPGDLTPPDERVCALVAGLVGREGTP